MCSLSLEELLQLLKQYKWDFKHMANRSRQEGYTNMHRVYKELDRRHRNASMYSSSLK